MKRYNWITVCALCVLTACTKPLVGEQMPWKGVLEEYACVDDTRQMLLVKHVSGSEAEAELWLKTDGEWVLDCSGSANVGRDGLGKTREGDMKTPEGEWHVGTAFGILDNPGTTMPYLKAWATLYACDDCETYYGLLIDTAEVHHDCKGEHIIACDPDYHYALTTSYNSERIFGKGCNIFVHCKGNKPYTAGCVALDEEMMKHLLMVCDTGLVVSIH